MTQQPNDIDKQLDQPINVLTLVDLDRSFGELKAEFRRTGQPVADFDLLIATVSLAENCVLVTNKIRHYNRIPGLQLENWTAP